MSTVAKGLDSRPAAPAEGDRLSAGLDRPTVLIDEFKGAADQIGTVAVGGNRRSGHGLDPVPNAPGLNQTSWQPNLAQVPRCASEDG
jgi:hypothetical protein